MIGDLCPFDPSLFITEIQVTFGQGNTPSKSAFCCTLGCTHSHKTNIINDLLIGSGGDQIAPNFPDGNSVVDFPAIC